MSAQDHKPLESGGLKSPFLTAELFTAEADQEESPGLAALQAESPFQHAFEAFAERSRSVIVPEVYEEEINEPEAEGFHENVGEPQEEEFGAPEEGVEQLYSDEEAPDLEEEELLFEPEEETEDTDLAAEPERETHDGLRQRLKYLSLLPHFTVVKGQDVPLRPGDMDPGIYDGAANYKIAPTSKLQNCLTDVMKKANFRPIKVALVDLTKGRMQPEFAASFDFKEQVFVASVAKIAAMLAVFQLRQDLRVAWKMKGAKTLAELFDRVRDDWAATQRDPGGIATPFTRRGVSLRGKLVLWNGERVGISDPKSPRLEDIFRPVLAGLPIEFGSTGETKAQLRTIVDEFLLKKEYEALEKAGKESTAVASKDAAMRAAAKKKLEEAKQELEKAKRTKKPEAKKIFDALGFWERLGIAVAGASDYAASTIVRDVGFPYIASTLLQSGLYDPSRGGGLWLGADYERIVWKGALDGGDAISATAGSLAAFMTLLAQRRLVSPEASGVMQFLMQKVPSIPFPGFVSWFGNGLGQLGALKKVLSKVGLARNRADECAYIEREVDDRKGGKKTLCYVAVGLRANRGSDLEQLIVEVDKCILANNL